MVGQYGLTGGIGSGKSFIGNIFKQMGIPVYISDIQAAKLYTYPHVEHAIKDLLGDKSYINGVPDKKYIAAQVFSNKELLLKLNQIIHPAVHSDYLNWLKKYEQKPYVLKESAILIENNLLDSLDGLISVLAPLELRIQRVLSRDLTNRADVLERMKNQTNDEIRIQYSEHLIINCPSHTLLRQIQLIHNTLIQKHKR